MKKFLSIKNLVLLTLTATAFVSCKEDENVTGTNPMLLSETKLDLALYASAPISVTNAGVDPLQIVFHSTDENVAIVKDGRIVTLNPGITYIAASLKDDYLATVSSAPCLVTVGNNEAISYSKTYPAKVTAQVKDTLEYLFKVNKTNVQAAVTVFTSDSISKTASFIFNNAKSNSADPDTCLVVINKANTFNFALVATTTAGEKYSTASIEVTSADVRPTSMIIATPKTGEVGYDQILASTTIQQGLATSLVVVFNEKTNYQSLKATSSDNTIITATPTTMNYATAYSAEGKVTKTEKRPAIKLMGLKLTEPNKSVTITVANNSDLRLTFAVNVVERVITDPIYSTTISIESTLDLVDEKTALPTPEFDDKTNVTYYEPTLSFAAIKDTKMLTANDISIIKNAKTGVLEIVKSDEWFVNQGSATLVVTAYKDKALTQPVQVKNDKGVMINLTASSIITIEEGVWSDPEVTFKQVFNHDANKYIVTARLTSAQGAITNFKTVTAKLYKNIYKKDADGDVELDADKKPIIEKTIQVANTLTFTKSTGLISGTFNAFSEGDDANLSQYFIDYEFVDNSGATFSKDDSKGFSLDDGFPFSLQY